MFNIFTLLFSVLILSFASASYAETPDNSLPRIDVLHIAGKDCAEEVSCEGLDVIVFVHVIYGDETTFQNGAFDFPSELEKQLQLKSKPVSIYRLIYRNRLVSWSKTDDLLFVDLASEVMSRMEKITKKNPRSIGFIAHSLGGNVVTTYMVTTKLRYGHIDKAKAAYIITLDTPFLGAQIANLGNTIKTALMMPNDGLLKSLELNNVYLQMLRLMRRYETVKGDSFGCRPTNLYVLYSEENMHGVPVVGSDSRMSMDIFLREQNSNYKVPIGYPLNHAQIAKPPNADAPIFQDVLMLVISELDRVKVWDQDHGNDKLCRFNRPQ